MSRCFPFPPPGYELKARLDDINLTIKDKHKHKKHKDKKDKEKKERSERKEKERSEDKHKEDKKRKRKEHKDKKEKSKDKEKNGVGFSEDQNGRKPYSEPANSFQDKRAIVELGNRVGNNGGATGNHMVHKITIVEREKINSLGKVQGNDNATLAVKDTRHHGKMANGIQEKRSIVEFGNRVGNNGGAMGNHMVDKITIGEREKIDMLGKVQENDNGMFVKDKRDHSKVANGQSLDSRSLANGPVRNCNGENQSKVDVNSYQVGKAEKIKERKERNGHGNVVGEGDGSKNGDQFKNKIVEDTKRKKEKEKKLIGFSRETVNHEKNECNSLDFHSKIPPNHLTENCEGKLPKLKELNDVLHAKENGVWPDNMSRPTFVSHQSGPVGDGCRPSQNTVSSGLAKRPVTTDETVNGELPSPQSVIDCGRNIQPNIKAENGRVSVNNRVVSNGVISPHIIRIERKVEQRQTSNGTAIVNHSANGKIPSSQPSAENEGNTAIQAPDASLKTNGSLEVKKSASLKRKEKVASTSKKPPHPDLAYLSRLLVVPEVEPPQFDDQDWLFEKKDSRTKRPKLAASETKQVWSESVRLDSADITALPYVIPY